MLFAACSHSDDENLISSQKSIVILYENDVHCNIQGYQKLAGLRDAIANSDTAYAGIVSCGDYLNGGVVEAASKGQYIVDIMLGGVVGNEYAKPQGRIILVDD